MQFRPETISLISFYLGYYTTGPIILQKLSEDYPAKVVDYVLILLEKLESISEPNPVQGGATLEGYYVTKVEDIEFSPAYSTSPTAELSDPAYLIRLLSRVLSIPLASNLFEDQGGYTFAAVQVR